MGYKSILVNLDIDGPAVPVVKASAGLAERFDMTVHLENEDVCNIGGFAGLEEIVTRRPHPRLKSLPDIANAWRAGQPPTSADLARLLPHTDMLHFKDWSPVEKRFVALGEGEVPYRTILADALTGHEGPLTFTIETHAAYDPANVTRRSVPGLRRLIDSLPLEA